jgi:hypothetical protein
MASFFQDSTSIRKRKRLMRIINGIKKGNRPMYGKSAGEIKTLEKIRRVTIKLTAVRSFIGFNNGLV